MKMLKENTIKSYSVKQLTRHLDRLLSLFDEAPYKVNWAYGQVCVLEGQNWLYYAPILERDTLIEIIQLCYTQLQEEGNL